MGLNFLRLERRRLYSKQSCVLFFLEVLSLRSTLDTSTGKEISNRAGIHE